MCETVTERRVASESYLKGAALRWGFGRGKKHLFPILWSNSFCKYFQQFWFIFIFCQLWKEGTGNLRERKYFIKESEFNVNRWHSHYRVLGGQWASPGLGIHPAATGRHTQAVGHKLRRRCPYVSAFWGQKVRLSLVFLHSGHLGEVWRAAADLDASLHRVSVYESEWVQWIDRGYLESSLV